MSGRQGDGAARGARRDPLWGRIQAVWVGDADRNVCIAIAVVTGLCLLDILLPTFHQLAHFDDSAYVRSGYRLVEEGRMTVLAWGPLMSVLYGLLYVFLQESPFWFVYLAAGGRLAIFALLFAGAYMCARAFSSLLEPRIALTIAAVWMVGLAFLQPWNSSDFLFMALSSMALSQLVRYRSDATLKRLALGSVCVGLAALTRNDGILLLASFVLLVFWMRPRPSARLFSSSWWKPVGVATLPALLLMGGYLAVYAVVTGSWEAGTMSRTYQAFEQGHGFTFRDRYSGAAMVEGLRDVRALFGTAAENGGSVLRAIANNPVAFGERLVHSIAGLPTKVSAAYGGPLLLALSYLAGRGVLHLWRARQRWAVAALALWHVHLLSYFVTFWSVRYTKFAFVALVVLAACGTKALASNLQDWRERAGLGVALLGVLAWEWGEAQHGVVPVTLVLLGGGIVWIFVTAWWDAPPKLAVRLSALGALALVLGVGAAAGRLPDGPLLPRVGQTIQERAVVVASEVLPPGTTVAAYGHKVLTAAKRPVRSLNDLLATEPSLSAIATWRGLDRVGGVFMDPYLRRRFPDWFIQLERYFSSHPAFFAAFSDEDSGTHLFVRHSVARARDVWRSTTPALRSGFDVYVLDDLLVYVKESCGAEDRERRFFLHVTPANAAELPERFREDGFEPRSFRFRQQGFVEDGRCVATRALPAYDIRSIRTGQYLPGKGRFWDGRIDLQEAGPNPTSARDASPSPTGPRSRSGRPGTCPGRTRRRAAAQR